jgi:hypothetical protein
LLAKFVVRTVAGVIFQEILLTRHSLQVFTKSVYLASDVTKSYTALYYIQLRLATEVVGKAPTHLYVTLLVYKS